eukprot:655527_1
MCLPEVDVLEKVRSVISEILNYSRKSSKPSSDENKSPDTFEEISARRKEVELLCAACFTCFGTSWPSTSHPASQLSHAPWLLGECVSSLGLSHWTVRVAILRALKRILTSLTLLAASLPASQWRALVGALLAACDDGKYAAIRLTALGALKALLERREGKEVKELILPDYASIKDKLAYLVENDP